MPILPYLEELSLKDNLLTGDDLHYLQQYTSLKWLDLSNNQIRDIEHMLKLKGKLLMLKNVMLAANPVQEQKFYRENFWEKLPQV